MSSNVKRKRPSMIDIPIRDTGLDDFVKESKLLNRSCEMKFEGDGYSVYCKSGKRGNVMEDRYVAIVSPDLKQVMGDAMEDQYVALANNILESYLQAFFGVFDGHGGPDAAEFAANNLEKNIMTEVLKREDIEQAVKDGYLTTDFEFLRKNIRGGTCAVTSFIYKGDLVVSNIGDCRAVLSREGVVEALTMDHTPSRQDERERIEHMKGYVHFSRGIWRVYGSLAVSRAIGNKYLKPWVIAEPTTVVFKIMPQCEFVILASDGLWNKVSNQEAVDVVRPFCVNVEKPESLSACKKLVELSEARGSNDDISVMVIQLPHFMKMAGLGI